MLIIYYLAGEIRMLIFIANSRQPFHFLSKAESYAVNDDWFAYLIVIASFRFKYGIKVSYVFDTRPICQSFNYTSFRAERWMEPSDARKVDRRDERSNRRIRDAPIAHPSCGCISFMVTGLYRGRAWSKQEIAPSTRGTWCRMSSLSTIFGSVYTEHLVELSDYGPGQYGPLISNDENEFPRVSLECREYDPPVFGSRYAQSLPAKNGPRSIRKSYKKMDLTKRCAATFGPAYTVVLPQNR